MNINEIDGRQFEFIVPTAWDGCVLFDMLVSFDMPFGLNLLVGVPSTKHHMSPDELITCMKLCLKYCREVKENPTNPDVPIKINVINELGGIGIIEGTSQLLTKLTAQYLIFFEEYWQPENS